MQLVRTDGLLVQASCSSRITEEQFFATVRGSAQRAGYDLVEVRRTGHAVDHPVTFAQGGYLKALFARVIPLDVVLTRCVSGGWRDTTRSTHVVDESCCGGSVAVSSGVILLASALPSSTPHWSKLLTSHTQPCTNTMCS